MAVAAVEGHIRRLQAITSPHLERSSVTGGTGAAVPYIAEDTSGCWHGQDALVARDSRWVGNRE
jgi:hypothetical protein